MAERSDFSDIYPDGDPNLEQALAYAIDAIDRGDLELGYMALGWVLQREPENPVAWLWMACTVQEEERKRECYERADSNNARRMVNDQELS
jgi:hypothetical protein